MKSTRVEAQVML